MLRRINLALMEADNTRRAADRRGRPALHPLAEYYGNWERERVTAADAFEDRSVSISLGRDQEC